jgi:hypothetical protein
MSDSVLVKSSKSPAKKKRPNGLDENDYKNLEAWSNQKWAWAFLRRNLKFQRECDRLKDCSDSEKLALAKQYGLRKFKDYHEDYCKKGHYAKPQFLNGSISAISNLDFELGNPTSRRIKMMPGKFLVFFDLASALKSEKFLDRQLENAQLLLKRKLKQIREQVGQDQKGVNPRHRAMGQYLRMLDAHAAGMSVNECGEIVSPRRVKHRKLGESSVSDVTSQFERKMKKAIEHTEVIYRYLAGMPSKTNARKIPLST